VILEKYPRRCSRQEVNLSRVLREIIGSIAMIFRHLWGFGYLAIREMLVEPWVRVERSATAETKQRRKREQRRNIKK